MVASSYFFAPFRPPVSVRPDPMPRLHRPLRGRPHPRSATPDIIHLLELSLGVPLREQLVPPGVDQFALRCAPLRQRFPPHRRRSMLTPGVASSVPSSITFRCWELTPSGRATIPPPMPLQVLQRPHWHGTPIELGDLFRLQKNRREARAALFTHQLGWEVRLLVGSQLEVVQTQVCRDQEEVLSDGGAVEGRSVGEGVAVMSASYRRQSPRDCDPRRTAPFQAAAER